ncbi:isochorismatase family protein [Rhizobium mongolense]|uniref:Isochorismate hydrolase n=1 Tax=Rhizobium mongolense TaxID=57676 RepID=A0A7W6RKX2_9HYPH|nr:isochorismatase family protein [Rhizobium mongolense]MBB4274332.1 isochorismate hydrolase [Rhizobium mongolense]
MTAFSCPRHEQETFQTGIPPGNTATVVTFNRLMTKRALVIIDLINDYLDHWSADKAARLIGETNKLAVAFREAGLPVIWARPEFRPDLIAMPFSRCGTRT